MSVPPSGLRIFLSELRRRRVFRVAAAYFVVAWAAIEVADTVVPNLGLPDWIIAAIIVVATLCFPFALVLAWAFDVTPDGVRRTDPATALAPSYVRAGESPHRRIPGSGYVGLGILLALVGFGGYAYLLSPGGDPPGAALEVSASAVAVLPFSYRGAPEYAYLGEGIVDLLSTKLDGVAGLRAVDPHALFGVLTQTDAGAAAAPAGAERVARQVGAGRYILGSITEVGGQLQIRATLYAPGGGPGASTDVIAEGEDDLFRAVDEAARQLLAERLGESADALTRLAALTTHSVPALRAYLEGERLLRRADGAAAGEAFERAIEQDSLFALAYYELSVARGWGAAGSAEEAAQRALALREQLPLQQRELLDAYYSYQTGDYEAAEAAYRTILLRTPTDVEAWYGLAEVIFHHAPLSGRLADQAEEGFRRVLGFQPDHAPSLYHLANIAAEKRDLALLDSVTDRIAALGSPYMLQLRVQQAFAHGDSAREAGMIAELARPEHASQIGGAFIVAAIRTGNLAALLALAEELSQSHHPAAVRRVALAWGQWIAFASGALDVSAALHAALRPIDASLALSLRAYTAAMPFAPADTAELRALRDTLRGLPDESVEELAFGGVPGAYTRALLLGLLSARLGDERQALAHAETLEQLPTAPELGSVRTDLAMEIRAFNEYVQGRPERALSTLEAMPMKPGVGSFAFVPWTGLAIARLLRGELLSRAGRLQEALRWYDAADAGSEAGVLNLAPAHLGMAQIHDRLGHPEEAARHYARFVELWQDADPELQSRVEGARRRLARLVEEGAE